MDITTFLGRLHPLIVHLPIGFLLLAGVFYFLGKRERYAMLHKALPLTFLLSLLSAGAAAYFGWLLARKGSYDSDTLFWHKWMGIGVVFLSALVYWWSGKNKKIPTWLIILTLGALGWTGHLGGAMTHGEDYLTQPLMGEKKVEKNMLPENPDSIIVYTQLIRPVLEKKCYTCHNDTKQNGGLNMATWKGLQKGGDGGKIIKHGAYESEWFKRVTLPQNSQKFMPPKGEPLTFGEISILKWWLENGAPQNAKLTSLKLTDEIKETLLHDYDLDLNPKPFVETVKVETLPETILTELDNAGWQVNTLAQSNNLLEVKPKSKKEIKEDAFRLLLKAKNHITWLNLGDMNLEDEHLKPIAQLTNLSRLRIENTKVTDAGLEHLVSLKNLESLNLFGNDISDQGIAFLQKMPALKKVYLWNTKITEEGRQTLKNGKIDLELM